MRNSGKSCCDSLCPTQTSVLFGSLSPAQDLGKSWLIVFARMAGRRFRSLLWRFSPPGRTKSFGLFSSDTHLNLAEVVSEFPRIPLQPLPDKLVAASHHKNSLTIGQRTSGASIAQTTVDRWHLHPGHLHCPQDELAITEVHSEVIHQHASPTRNLIRTSGHGGRYHGKGSDRPCRRLNEPPYWSMPTR